MSIEAIAAVLRADLPGGKGAAHKLVLVVLANRANRQWRCWPSLRSIAKQAGLSYGYTQHVLVDLREAGLVSIEVPHRQHRTPLYRISAERLEALRGGRESVPERTARHAPGSASEALFSDNGTRASNDGTRHAPGSASESAPDTLPSARQTRSGQRPNPKAGTLKQRTR